MWTGYAYSFWRLKLLIIIRGTAEENSRFILFNQSGFYIAPFGARGALFEMPSGHSSESDHWSVSVNYKSLAKRRIL